MWMATRFLYELEFHFASNGSRTACRDVPIDGQLVPGTTHVGKAKHVCSGHARGLRRRRDGDMAGSIARLGNRDDVGGPLAVLGDASRKRIAPCPPVGEQPRPRRTQFLVSTTVIIAVLASGCSSAVPNGGPILDLAPVATPRTNGLSTRPSVTITWQCGEHGDVVPGSSGRWFCVLDPGWDRTMSCRRGGRLTISLAPARSRV